MATEDKFIVTVDTSTGQVNLEKLQKKTQQVYSGIAKLAGSKELPSKGITRYTFEIEKATKKVNELAKANAALQKSYPKHITNVSSTFRAGRKGKTPVQVAAKAAANVAPIGGVEDLYPEMGTIPLKKRKPTSVSSAALPPPPKSAISKDTQDVIYTSIADLGDKIKSRKPKGGTHGYMDTLKPLPTTPKITGKFTPQPGMGDFSVLPNVKQGNWNQQNANIDWVKPGDTRFRPVPPPKAPKNLQFQQTKMGNTLKRVNMSLFKLQMASLGVYFSFMGIEKGITGLFNSLQDLGGTFKAGALGKAFGGVDVAGTMGVGGGEMVQGWKNITGIISMITSATSALAAMTLTPEVMAAVQEMFTALATALSDGKVAKALGDIIIAFTDLVVSIVDSGLLIVIADLITALGDSGLLAPIIGLVLGAQYLLAGLSLLGFGMQAITLIIEGVSLAIPLITGAFTAAAAALGTSIGVVIAIIGLVLIAIDLLINIFENFAATGDIIGSIINGITDTFWDLYNVLLPIMNLIGGALGWEQRAVATTHSGEYSRQTQITNNYNLNGNYDDPGAAIKKIQQSKSTAY